MNTESQASQYEVVVSTIEKHAQSLENGSNLRDTFLQFIEGIDDLKEEAMSIVVESPDQTDLISRASVIRKELKKKRVAADKEKKRLKEGVLLQGRAIDGMYNIVKAFIVPIEQHLQNQEKIAERLEKERLEALKAKRESLLAPYVEDVASYNVETISEEAFEIMLSGAKSRFEQAKKDREEAERLAREQQARRARELEEAREAARIADEKLRIQQERARKELERTRERTRMAAVRPYMLPGVDYSMFNYKTMTDAEFDLHLQSLRIDFENAQNPQPAPEPTPAPTPDVDNKPLSSSVDKKGLMAFCNRLTDPFETAEYDKWKGEGEKLYFHIMSLLDQ